MLRVALFIAGLLVVQLVSAATTALYIPGFDPQPLSVDVVGVSGDETTYAIQAVSATGTEDESGIEGTVTLVEGASHAFLTYVFPDPDLPLTIGYDCDLQDGQAICSGIQDGVSYTLTETATDIDVLIGATAATTGDSAASTSATSLTQTSGGASGSGAATSSTSGSQPESTSNGAGIRIASSRHAAAAAAAFFTFTLL